MDKLCVIAMDIGETDSCFLFSFKKEPNKFESVTHWRGSSLNSMKVPTTVLFNEERDFHSFGFEAQNHYADLRNGEQKKKWFYFQGFGRMACDCTMESTLSDATGKKMGTYIVFGSAIKFFKDTMVELFEKRINTYVSDLHFVMIVPSVFTKSLQTVLKEAFLYAGIKEGNYSFVRESEAVFSYWKYIMTAKPTYPDLTDGKCFLIVSLKGRTATITAQTASHGFIRRLHSISGGGWGGQAVNEEFKQLLIKIVGAPVFLQFVEEESSDNLVELESQIEIMKRTCHPEYDGKVTFPLPASLSGKYEAYFKERIADAVKASPFAGNIKILDGKLRMDTSVFRGLFKNAIETMVLNINNTLRSDAVKDVETKVIFLVGVFSDSLLVQDAVRKAFPSYQVICAEEPTFTVGKGAVLHGHYGHHTEIRPSVISKFTYGVHFCQVNDEGGRSEVERSETKVLVKKGNKVYRGDEVTWKLHVDLCDEEHIEIQFFVSPRAEIVTLDEDDVACMDIMRIDSDGAYSKDIEVRIAYGYFGFFGEVLGRHVDFKEFK